MENMTKVQALRSLILSWRLAGDRVGFVPTMGCLHAGHLALIKGALSVCDRVVVSIYVNPSQFGPQEDFAEYPRPLEKDRELLLALGVDALFVPADEEIYPEGYPGYLKLSMSALANLHCGVSRPHFFSGVLLILLKLLNSVQPDQLFLGAKDYQQAIVVRTLISEGLWPVELTVLPTVREADGLAFSSRNQYLSAAERERAPVLYQTLQWMAQQLKAGGQTSAGVLEGAESRLRAQDMRVDYLNICRAADVQPASESDNDLVILVAVWLGRTRLIDNVTCER